MAKFQIVVEDVKKTNEFYVRNNHGRVAKLDAIHAVVDETCPLGGQNCRNCGDPIFAELCKSKGHCPDCGTKHGIAPKSVLDKNGFILKKVQDE